MTSRVSAGPTASLAYEATGAGIPLLAFHGAYSSRIEVREFLEPMVHDLPIRRIYVDLPGHGESRPSSGVAVPDDVLELADLLLAKEAPEGRASASRGFGAEPHQGPASASRGFGAEPHQGPASASRGFGAEPHQGQVLLLGHSYGGHFARALAARHPSRIAGLALICPVVAGMDVSDVESGAVIDDGASADLGDDDRAAFEEYFVVRTAETLERFRRAVVPATGEVDEETLGRAIEVGPHAIDPDSVAVAAPVVIMSGRRDRWVGWRQQERLGDRYPHATVVTVGDAGHALPHERPGLVAALLRDWLDEVRDRGPA